MALHLQCLCQVHISAATSPLRLSEALVWLQVEGMSRIEQARRADLNVTDCAGDPFLDNRIDFAHMPTQKDTRITPITFDANDTIIVKAAIDQWCPCRAGISSDLIVLFHNVMYQGCGSVLFWSLSHGFCNCCELTCWADP